MDAALHYLCDTAISKIQKRLLTGHEVVIGPCTLSRQGIAFRTQGWLFPTDHFIGWRDVVTDMRNGHVVVRSKPQPEIAVVVPMSDTDNAVLLPILGAMMGGEQGATGRVTPHQSRVCLTANNSTASPTNKPINVEWRRELENILKAVAWAFVAAVVLLIICGITSTGSTVTKSTGDSKSRKSAVGAPSYSPISAGGSSSLDEGVSADLDRDRRQIEIEKGKAERMTRELEELAEEIRRKRLFLDRTSEIDVAAFNWKVNRHNDLLEELGAQERRVNQLVDSYNRKLR